MALEYFPCYYSYGRKIAKLSDQEVGRLFRSLIQYGETGEAQELAGREAVAFDFIADDIDRAKEAYEAKCVTNRANGSERKRTVANGSDGERTPPKPKPKENKNKDNKPPVSPLQGDPVSEAQFSDSLEKAVREWLRYKEEKKDGYKETGLKSLISQIRNQAAANGEQAVIDLIRQCMASNWKGIQWDKLTEPVKYGKKEIPKGASGELGQAELEAIQRALREG